MIEEIDDLYNENTKLIDEILIQFQIIDAELAEELNESVWLLINYIIRTNKDIFYQMDDIEYIWILINPYLLKIISKIDDEILDYIYKYIIYLLNELNYIYQEYELYERCANIKLHLEYFKKAILINE